MKRNHKLLLGIAVTTLVVGFAGLIFLYSRAPDFWNYAKLGVSERTTQSPVYFVEVYGVGHLPTMCYLVRCPDRAQAPKNMLEVSHSVVPQIKKRTRVMDRWRSECLLLVERKVGETIPIKLDPATAHKWFDRPGDSWKDFGFCQKFWDEVASPQIVEFDRNHPGVGL